MNAFHILSFSMEEEGWVQLASLVCTALFAAGVTCPSVMRPLRLGSSGCSAQAPKTNMVLRLTNRPPISPIHASFV